MRYIVEARGVPTTLLLQAMVKRSALVFVFLCTLWLDGCSNPTRKVERYAQEQGFQSDLISGSAFRHRVYRRHAASAGGGTLHVYIEGDGSPFAERTTVTSNPTPRDPLMLRLMALDPAPSVYLGRPCYFDLQSDGLCNPSYWTVRRFSPEVVDSLTTALLSEAARAQATRLELFGHSGGATLAVLLAERVRTVTRVVTIGANLDINAWTDLHGYSRLSGSLNPTDIPWHYAPPQMLHLVGSEDSNTPPALVTAAAPRAGGGGVRVIEGYTHNCCWERIWPAILREPVYAGPQIPQSAAH
jgi:hypothetical protein